MACRNCLAAFNGQPEGLCYPPGRSFRYPQSVSETGKAFSFGEAHVPRGEWRIHHADSERRTEQKVDAWQSRNTDIHAGMISLASVDLQSFSTLFRDDTDGTISSIRLEISRLVRDQVAFANLVA